MFNQAIADEICDHISKGKTLASILPIVGISRTTLHNWRMENASFADEFARAKDAGYDAIADDSLSIADDGSNDYVKTDDGVVLNHDHIQRSKLRVETRLKLLAKWDPKRYGDRIQQDVDAKLEITLVDATKRSE